MIAISDAITPGGPFPVVNGGAQKIVNVADPTAAQDVATKNYVDANSAVRSMTRITGNPGTTVFTAFGIETRAITASGVFQLPNAPTDGSEFLLVDGDANFDLFPQTLTTVGGVVLIGNPYRPGIYATSLLLNQPGEYLQIAFSGGRYIVQSNG